jgi:dTDP-4-amino-4,6-dideoxygalactose transaminase
VTTAALETIPFTDLAAATADLRSDLDRVWDDAVSRGHFIGGELVERFEEEWAAYCGTAHAIGIANGTDALELTLRGLGIGQGDEVIVPTNTFVATVEAIVFAGATPRFVDVDSDSLLLTPEIVASAITARTAAVIAVDLYGHLPRLRELAALADRHHIALIEDAAQAHGASVDGGRAGSFGVAGSFSFYPTKNLGAFGDAGAVVTDDGALAAAVRTIANHGRPPGEPNVHAVLARNCRLDALQAGVLSVKLARLDEVNDARRRAAALYHELLHDGAGRPVTPGLGSTSVYHLFVVRVPARDELMDALRSDGIQSGIHYPTPCHLQLPYRGYAEEPLPVAEAAAGEILSLPLFPHITEAQISRVCAFVNEHVARNQ